MIDTEHGIQPLDSLLNKLSISNETLVKNSKEQLTFKQIQKARRGKNITVNIKGKIVRALNSLSEKENYKLSDLFNY